MTWFFYYVLGAGVLWVWTVVCIERTYVQRQRLIKLYYEQGLYKLFGERWNTCGPTYNQHILALFLFRNPYRLYEWLPPELSKGKPAERT